MSGVWIIEDFYECAAISNSIWSRNWKKNKTLTVEALAVLDLVDAAAKSTKGVTGDKFVTHSDCRKSWELLISEKLKASQVAGDEISTIFRIIELERKSKIEFECMHVKTTNNEDNTIVNKYLEKVLKWDKQAKEEIIRDVRENRIENISVFGNTSLQCGKEILEKSSSKVIKSKDSDDHCEE